MNSNPPVQFRIDHDGHQLGPLSLAEVHAGLAAGTITPSDLALHTGALEWETLADIPGVIVNGPPPPPPVEAPPAEVAETPRPEIRKLNHRRLNLLISFAVIVVIASFAAGWISHQIEKGKREEASDNLRALGYAMVCFETEYGTFPSDESAKDVRECNPDMDVPLGNKSSNDYFRQLIASGYVDLESSFYANIAGVHKPDNRMDGGHCLEKGECAFSYNIGCSSKASPAQPLMLTPMIPGTDRFDPKPFGGMAVILWTDQSVTTPPIDRSGHVIHNGVSLLDPANPVWHGKPPRIVWPE